MRNDFAKLPTPCFVFQLPQFSWTKTIPQHSRLTIISVPAVPSLTYTQNLFDHMSGFETRKKNRNI